MENGYKIVNRFTTFAKRNGEWHHQMVLKKLSSILYSVKLETGPEIESKRLYATAKKYLNEKAHISINVSWERFLELAVKDELPVTKPVNEADAKLRENAEMCFRDNNNVSPIYGALNWDSSKGGAPSYSPDLWLKVNKEIVENHATFTSRDSYTILLPYFNNFNIDSARLRLYQEIFDWSGIIDYCLDRFWTIQHYDTPEYIEAQIWKRLTLDDIDSVHVLKSLHSDLVQELNSGLLDKQRSSRIVSMLKIFNLRD